MDRQRSLFKLILDNCKREEGAVVVFVALSMVVLLGISALAIDMGLAYNETSKLQNALDSAALAAVQELPADDTNSNEWVSAVSTAINYADFNNAKVDEGDISPVYSGSEIIGVEVRGKKSVPYYFGRVIGLDKMTISRSATAELKGTAATSITSMKGVAPIGVSVQIMDGIYEGKEVTLEHSKNKVDISPGEFVAVKVGTGGGANAYRENIKNGIEQEVSIGDILDVEKGNMGGHTHTGFTARIEGHGDCTFENHEKDCKRLMYVFLIEPHNDSVKVVGFAYFFLVDIDVEGKITAKYISSVMPGSEGEDGGESSTTGEYIPKLTK